MIKTKDLFNNRAAIGLFGALAAMPLSLYAQQCQPIVWQDNFDQSTLDTSAWQIQTGDGCDQGAGMCGWGNNELQNYQADNITLANGVLTIEARKQRIRGTQYTSGRIRTANMPASGEWAFGRFEARLKFPDGQGMWPAFWMLPSNPTEVWPISGEIDILESVGQSANTAYGTIHYGQPWPDNSHQGGSILMQPGKWSDDFHTYAIEWNADEIRWYVDNLLYSTKTVSDVAPEDWPFDGRNNFHLILNLAVGGNWGGAVDDSVLPQKLEVDYVRVYAGAQPNLSGNHLPAPGSTETYTVENPGANTSWSVTGGTINGSGNTVQVTWHEASAASTQTITANSGGCEVSTNIYVGKKLTTETVLEDFESTSNMVLTSANGAYNVANGALTYTRDSASQWDVIAYSTAAISDAAPFLVGDKAFQLTVYNSDPALIGKQILIQLENTSTATPTNYPTGRHSKYQAVIESENGWQTLRFSLLERIDGATSDTSVDALLLLIDPDSFNGDSYILDNIEILGTNTSAPNLAPVASFTNSCNQLSCSFNGTASTDPDGAIANYLWEFGDGNTSTLVSPSHEYMVAGDYLVSLTVTDNQGATNTSTKSVSVVSETATPTHLVIGSVTTGTQSAGKGKKRGTATVTILNNLGQAVSGVSVTGIFSGSWSESATGITDANGNVSLVTSSALSGGVQVGFCVSSVSGALPLDESASTGQCQ